MWSLLQLLYPFIWIPLGIFTELCASRLFQHLVGLKGHVFGPLRRSYEEQKGCHVKMAPGPKKTKKHHIEKRRSKIFKWVLSALVKIPPFFILCGLWSHLLAAGATDTSKQSVNHLDETEDELHARRHQQGGEQTHVEFNHILWLFTPIPHVLVGQVATVTAKYLNEM